MTVRAHKQEDEGTADVEFERIVEVEGSQYLIQAMQPSKAFKLATRISKIIAEPLAAMAVDQKDGAKVEQALRAAMKAFTANIHEDSVWDMVVQVLGTVTAIEGKKSFAIPSAMELYFRGRMGLMMKVVSAAMEFQFRDFFEAIAQEYAEMRDEDKGAQG